jgi:DNA-binding beta-propeller fold protein YncE
VDVRPQSPDVHAFVHTLAVNEGWAYCIDLPAPFGDAAPESHAIARSNLGTVIHVVAAGSGAVAALDPTNLTVLRVGSFEPAPGAASVVFETKGDRLYVASGKRLTVLDAQSFTTAAVWALPGPARGLSASGVLYVGQPNEIVALDLADGAVRRRISVPGLSTLRATLL